MGSKTMIRMLRALLISAALVLVACGGDDDAAPIDEDAADEDTGDVSDDGADVGDDATVDDDDDGDGDAADDDDADGSDDPVIRDEDDPSSGDDDSDAVELTGEEACALIDVPGVEEVMGGEATITPDDFGSRRSGYICRFEGVDGTGADYDFDIKLIFSKDSFWEQVERSPEIYGAPLDGLPSTSALIANSTDTNFGGIYARAGDDIDAGVDVRFRTEPVLGDDHWRTLATIGIDAAVAAAG